MNSYRFERIDRASALPDEWNEVAGSYFQRKEFLLYTEIYNPCRQRYYLLWKENALIAGASVYSLSVHLFTFSRIPSRMNMQVLGVPVSVSPPGIIGRSMENKEQLIRHILKAEKGLLLGLNLPPGIQLQPAIEMTMMPTIVLNRHFVSWENYIGSLRSCYRRRAFHITKAFEQVKQVSTGCDAFRRSHYDLYLQVMDHTKEKLETLSFEFFQNLPSNFTLTSYYKNTELLCWHITCEDKDRLVFFLGGHDYKSLHSCHSYFNNLFGVLKQFISGRYKQLDLGQTAEIAKMKTGGEMDHKVLFIYHRNAFIRSLLRLVKPFLAYHPPKTRVHPFKKRHIVQVKTGSNKILFVRPQPSPDTIGLQHVMVVEPLELEVLAAAAGDRHEYMIADMILEKQSLDQVIMQFKPDVFCVTGYITHMTVMKEYCRTAKSLLPGVVTVTGGVHIEKFPEDGDDASIDFRVVRNATRTFPMLLRHIEYNTGLPPGVLKTSETIREEELPPYDFYYPLPKRELTSKYRSWYFYVFHHKVALLKTSFGCPYTCNFCFCRTITGGNYYARPLDDVITELKQIREKEIYIVDDDFLLSVTRLRKFIQRIKQEKINKRYLVFGRADFIADNKEIIEKLHEVGLRAVIVGLESFNDRELSSFEKRTNSHINEKALQVLRSCGVDCYAAVITSPGWDENDFKKAGDKLLELGVKIVNLQPLTPLKGTGVNVSDEDLVISRDDYARWDLAHVSIRPKKMSVSDYYYQVMRLYERVLFHPKNLLTHMLRFPLFVQWRLVKGLMRVHRQYRNRIKYAKTHYAKNPVHTAHTV